MLKPVAYCPLGSRQQAPRLPLLRVEPLRQTTTPKGTEATREARRDSRLALYTNTNMCPRYTHFIHHLMSHCDSLSFPFPFHPTGRGTWPCHPRVCLEFFPVASCCFSGICWFLFFSKALRNVCRCDLALYKFKLID